MEKGEMQPKTKSTQVKTQFSALRITKKPIETVSNINMNFFKRNSKLFRCFFTPLLKHNQIFNAKQSSEAEITIYWLDNMCGLNEFFTIYVENVYANNFRMTLDCPHHSQHFWTLTPFFVYFSLLHSKKDYILT